MASPHTGPLPRTRARLGRGVDLGWHTGAQLFASVNSEVVADAIGEARPGVPMTPATIVEWGSATKAVTCCAVVMLRDRGLLALDDPVARHIPEFGAAGKQAVTVRHLLTHTSGVSNPTEGIAPFEEVVAAICGAPLADGWVPGERTAYNSDAMWILAALVYRLTGQPFARFVREEVFEPLGLVDSWMAIPPERFKAFADRIAVIPGVPESGTEEWVTWGRPTGGVHGPIGDLGRFYAALLAERLLAPESLAEMTTPHVRGTFDERLGVEVDRGLGFLLASSYAGHGYGPHASPRAFGHGGRNWCVGFADPAHDLAVAVYWNGRADSDTHAARVTGTLGALYEDPGLA